VLKYRARNIGVTEKNMATAHMPLAGDNKVYKVYMVGLQGRVCAQIREEEHWHYKEGYG